MGVAFVLFLTGYKVGMHEFTVQFQTEAECIAAGELIEDETSVDDFACVPVKK